jgi:ABC-type branched-subunit amino acid transport system substrate-binding protein
VTTAPPVAPDPDAARVAVVLPLSGALGLAGPSSLACLALAVEEVEARGGLLGRPLRPVLVDAGDPERAVAAVRGLASSGAVQAVVGMHTSDLRVRLAAALRGRTPYVFTPPYEGGERSPAVICVGETPEQQLRPALAWLVERHDARRWLLYGNDYVWPRRVHRSAARWLRALGARVVGQMHVPLGTGDHAPALGAVRRLGADAVLVDLVGDDLVAFNRQVARDGPQGLVRLAGALEENGVLAAGGDGTGRLYSAMGYFAHLATRESFGFLERYVARHGAEAPVPNAHAQSLHEGILALEALARRAGTLEPGPLARAAEGAAFAGARGPLVVHRRHVRQPVHLARVDGLDLDVVATL